jgi:hypothetical protein
MSDETLHDRAPKATKALLGTVAFILIMVGIADRSLGTDRITKRSDAQQ